MFVTTPADQPARWLLAVAIRLVREVSVLLSAARPAMVTALDGRVRFASATQRAAFAAELVTGVGALVGKYHDERAPGGREYRVIVALHAVTTDIDETTGKGS